MSKNIPYREMTEEQKTRAKEAVRRYRKKYPEKAKAIADRYRAKNPKASDRWRLTQPEKYKEARRRYRAENVDKINAQHRAYMAQLPDYHWSRKLAAYNLTPKQYEELHEKQAGLCAICQGPETRVHHRTKKPQRLAVDHCHKTGKVRGLLCYRCNYTLGMMRDSAALLQAASDYLRAAAV